MNVHRPAPVARRPLPQPFGDGSAISTARALVGLDLRRAADKLLVLLVVGDLALIAVHLLHAYTPVLEDRVFAITTERGIGETIQYYKEGLIVLVLAATAVMARSAAVAAWGIVAFVLLWDDLFATRERFAVLASRVDQLPALIGLRPQDVGEILFVGIYVVIVALPVAAAYVLAPRTDRWFWWSMVGLLAALFFFGVVFDVVHVLLRAGPAWDGVLSAFEEGGEMLAVSVILRLVFAMWHGTTPDPTD